MKENYDQGHSFNYDGSQSYDDDDYDPSTAWAHSAASIERMKMIEEIKALQNKAPKPITLGNHLDINSWVQEQLNKQK